MATCVTWLYWGGKKIFILHCFKHDWHSLESHGTLVRHSALWRGCTEHKIPGFCEIFPAAQITAPWNNSTDRSIRKTLFIQCFCPMGKCTVVLCEARILFSDTRMDMRFSRGSENSKGTFTSPNCFYPYQRYSLCYLLDVLRKGNMAWNQVWEMPWYLQMHKIMFLGKSKQANKQNNKWRIN